MSTPALLPTTTMSTDELRDHERTHGKLNPTAARERFLYRRDQIQARVLASAPRGESARLIYRPDGI